MNILLKAATALNKFHKDESGATAIEYALIAGLMATMLIAAMATLSPAISGAFGTIATALTGGSGG